MFISKEVEALYYQYKDNPFGNKKDSRIESWLEILNRLPSILIAEVELVNEVSVDFDFKDSDKIHDIEGFNKKLLKIFSWKVLEKIKNND